MPKHVPFNIVSGLPFGRTINVTLPTARDWWLLSANFEVLGQIREAQDVNSPLLLDLAEFMTVTFDGVDLVSIDLDLNGEDTRKILRNGYYDIVISDTFAIDDRAFVITQGAVYRSSLVTGDTEVINL